MLAIRLLDDTEACLEYLEDYYLSAETVAKIRCGEESVHSSEDVRKILGLDN